VERRGGIGVWKRVLRFVIKSQKKAREDIRKGSHLLLLLSRLKKERLGRAFAAKKKASDEESLPH